MPIEMGIGINTGAIIWGTIGSKVRMESAVIGDPVNLASRLQSLTRQYGAMILNFGTHVLQQIPDLSKYGYREVDIVQVKGKSEAVAVYEFFDGDPEPIKSQKRMAVVSCKVLCDTAGNEWQHAQELFATCLKACPDDW